MLRSRHELHLSRKVFFCYQIMSEQKKEFTGVWIPRMVVEDEELNWTDRACYAEIACYQKCFASNAFLAKRLGISESMVSKIVARLKQLEYLVDGGFNGRFRVLVARQPSNTLLGSIATDCEAASQPVATIDNSRENSKELEVSKETPTSLSTKEEQLDFVPTNGEGDETAPKKKPKSWDKEKSIFAMFCSECKRAGLPEPEPVKLWQLTQIRNVLKSNDETFIVEILEDWLSTAGDEVILNIHSALSAHNINKHKMKR